MKDKLIGTTIFIAFVCIVSAVFMPREKEKQPEYKIELLNQKQVRIESTDNKRIDTIYFEGIQEWIEKDNL